MVLKTAQMMVIHSVEKKARKMVDCWVLTMVVQRVVSSVQKKVGYSVVPKAANSVVQKAGKMATLVERLKGANSARNLAGKMVGYSVVRKELLMKTVPNSVTSMVR